MNISNCITFLINNIVTIMSSAPVFPFVGFCLAALVLDYIIGFVKRR